MGLTIHFETHFRGSKTELVAKLGDLADFARIIGFEEVGPIYPMDFASDFNTPDKFTPMVKDEKTGEMVIDGAYRWAKIQAIPRAPMIFSKDSYQTRQKKAKKNQWLESNMHRYNGFVLNLWVGEGSEPTNLCFIRLGNGNVWKGGSFTKTCYATEFVKAHTRVCTLLQAGERMGLVKKVSDEGHYYETGDLTQLVDSEEESMTMIAALGEALKQKFGDNVTGGFETAKERLEDYS